MINAGATPVNENARGMRQRVERKVDSQEHTDQLGARLRRYARAFVAADPAPNAAADRLAAAALRRFTELSPSLPLAEREADAYGHLVDLSRTELRAPAFGAQRPGGGFSGGSAAQAHEPQNLDPALAALGALKPEEREALLLVVLEGFAYARAAQILKISPGLFAARLACARERMPQRPRQTRSAKPLPSHLRVVK